jgi:hypothetical protein
MMGVEVKRTFGLYWSCAPRQHEGGKPCIQPRDRPDGPPRQLSTLPGTRGNTCSTKPAAGNKLATVGKLAPIGGL